MTAWEFFRTYREKYKKNGKFLGWLYQEFTKDKNRLGYSTDGVYWILEKPEQEAIEIMNRFVKEHEK